ncbi:MAG: hypothetical protein WD534_00900 [Phycisphaeraceae bacterium]
MSRRLKQTFRCQPLRELARQLQFAPAGRRIAQARRAERLHDEIDPGRTYPLEFIIYRLTGYRPETDDALLLVGEAIRPDLRLIIDQISRDVALPADPDDPVETLAHLADRLGVSTKTLGRWRTAGLRWRWMALDPAGRKQIVIPRSAFEQFQARHGSRIDRARQFTQLDAGTREAIIRRARRLAEARNVSFNEVATHLARRTGRALETIRLILAKHDREHPETPIFADRTGPLTVRQRRLIARAYRFGVPVSRLCRRFDRTRATIYRALHQQRAAEIRRLPLAYVPSPMFDRDDADAVILRPTAQGSAPAKPATRVAVDDLPAPLCPLFAGPALPAERQRSLFIRYNYLKCKARRVRDALHRHEPRGSDLDAFDRYLAAARQVQALLVAGHRPVVLSVARRHLIGEPQTSAVRLLELLEAGQRVLVEAVEQFNAARSTAFESHLTNRLLQRFAADRATGTRARRRRSPDELVATILRDVEPGPAASRPAADGHLTASA